MIFGQFIKIEFERLFQVSTQDISIHISLHRFISKVLYFATVGGVEFDILDLFHTSSLQSIASLVEYPMCCLAMSAQVHAGMWRRNGSPVANLIYNYSRVPLCKSLRDADIILIQTGLIKIGPDEIISLAIRRFEVYEILFSNSIQNIPKKNLEYLGPLLVELLRFLSIFVSHVPSPVMNYTTNSSSLSSSSSNNINDNILSSKFTLAREIAHLVMSGAQKQSALQSIKALIGRVDSISDDEMRDVVDYLCIRKEGDEGEPTILELKHEGYELFDFEHPHLSYQQLQVIIISYKLIC
jgi:hypothetical protein